MNKTFTKEQAAEILEWENEQERKQELIQETRQAEFDTWVDDNKKTLASEFAEEMQDEFDIFCKTIYNEGE